MISNIECISVKRLILRLEKVFVFYVRSLFLFCLVFLFLILNV